MYTFRVRNRKYLQISKIFGVIWLCGIILSLYLYKCIVDGILRWVKMLLKYHYHVYGRKQNKFTEWECVCFYSLSKYPSKTQFPAKCIWNYHFHWSFIFIHIFDYKTQTMFKMVKDRSWKILVLMFLSNLHLLLSSGVVLWNENWNFLFLLFVSL